MVQFRSNLREVTRKLENGYERNLFAAGQVWKGGVVKTLTGNRSGRWYRVPGTRSMYRASAPGEPPASATGRLRSNIEMKLDRESVVVGTNVRYALYLERGTSKMRPRPFIRRGLESVRGAIRAALTQRIE